MIKNWIVTTRQIKNASKGLIRYANYLLDTNRPSHYKTNIVEIKDTQVSAARIIADHEYRKALSAYFCQL
jgi:hypothetical protein